MHAVKRVCPLQALFSLGEPSTFFPLCQQAVRFLPVLPRGIENNALH